MATTLRQEPYYISEKEYLAGELVNEIKHEYVDGQVYAMTGGTPNHVRISGNIFAEIRNFLKGKKCEALQSDMKVRIAENNYRYPDVVVICSDSEESYTDSPVILVEVLSNSTRQTGPKRNASTSASQHSKSMFSLSRILSMLKCSGKKMIGIQTTISLRMRYILPR